MRADVRRRVRELAAAVIADREDARVVVPVLRVMLETAIADFERYHDARHATNRVVDHDILVRRNREAKAKVSA